MCAYIFCLISNDIFPLKALYNFLRNGTMKLFLEQVLVKLFKVPNLRMLFLKL